FDVAFFNADHQLQMIGQMVHSLDEFQLSDDLVSHLSQTVTNVTGHLSTMAFCFAQLMCRTILLSENCFILKVVGLNRPALLTSSPPLHQERLKHQQMENFHLKSDKSFMEFVRKLATVYTPPSGHSASKS